MVRFYWPIAPEESFGPPESLGPFVQVLPKQHHKENQISTATRASVITAGLASSQSSTAGENANGITGQAEAHRGGVRACWYTLCELASTSSAPLCDSRAEDSAPVGRSFASPPK
eukprot:scaffold219313_cov17-Tisochrysis_lutea.AAC.2